jgi:hypothetical protein
MSTEPKKYVTLREAKRLTGIEHYTLRNMIKRKEIVGFLRGHRAYMVALNIDNELCYIINNPQ